MNKRLIGPSTITIALCALVGDYLFLSDSPWSISRFLGRFLQVFGAIVAPSIQLNYRWLGQAIVPMSLIILVLMLVWISVFRAKRAMSIATPDVDLEPHEPLRIVAPSPSRILEAESPPHNTRKRTLMRRLVIAFSVVGIVFGAIVCLIVYSFLGGVIAKDVKSRTDAMALGLREMIVPRIVAGSRTPELTELIDKFVSDGAFAYLYVENGRGEIIAHWPPDLPRYLRRDFPSSAERALVGVDDEYRELPVYEIAKRLDGNSGFAHLAIWRGAIDDQARGVLIRIAVVILGSLLIVIALFIRVMHSVNRPFVEIVGHAERISKGDFDVPLRLQRTDEIGELARSLERMRSSLRAVLARLEQAPLAKQSSK